MAIFRSTFTHPLDVYLSPPNVTLDNGREPYKLRCRERRSAIGLGDIEMRRAHRLPRVIPITCKLPAEALHMLDDFKTMVNHLISWALHFRVHDRWRMWDLNRDWFRRSYGRNYAAHYLHSACSVASELLSSWVKLGGNTSHRPYIHNKFARLDRGLVKVERLEGEAIRMRITLAPRQWVYINVPVHHKKWREYSQHNLGELVIVPDGIRLIFQTPDLRTTSEKLAGIDLNFNRVVVATQEGQIKEMDISRVMEVQENHREGRQGIQRRMPKNLRKQRKLLAKDRSREHRRVEDLLFELSNEVLSLLGDYGPVWEDLSSTTKECLVDAKGKKFRAKLSSWAHGQFQDITAEKSLYKSRWRYARGTSSYCPFCGSKLEHPIWRISRCRRCGYDYDRDRLSSVSVLIRGLTTHRKGEPWALAKDALTLTAVALLQDQCIIKVLQSSTAGRTGEEAIPSGLWELPPGTPFAPGGPFIPNAPPNGPNGRATSVPVYGHGRRQGLGTAMKPMTGYGANTQGWSKRPNLRERR